MSLHARAPTHSSDAIILASLLSTFLAPLFAYLCVCTVAGYPFMGLAFATVGSIYIVPFFPMIAPHVFLLILASTGLTGWLLSHHGIRHPAIFALAGAGVALLSWSVGLDAFGAWNHLAFVGRHGTSAERRPSGLRNSPRRRAGWAGLLVVRAPHHAKERVAAGPRSFAALTKMITTGIVAVGQEHSQKS